MTWLVIGYGSGIRGDDGFGIVVAQAVAEAQTSAVVVKTNTLVPELIEKIRIADGVIFVDANLTLACGQMQRTELKADKDQNTPETISTSSSHDCAPQTLIQLNYLLNKTEPPAWLFSVGGAEFDFSQHLSESVKACVETVRDEIITLIT